MNPTMIQAAMLLEGAAGQIDALGLIKGVFQCGGKTGPVCAMGALQKAHCGDAQGQPFDPVFLAACGELAAAIDTRKLARYNHCPQMSFIEQWNNAPERTEAEVTGLMRAVSAGIWASEVKHTFKPLLEKTAALELV